MRITVAAFAVVAICAVIVGALMLTVFSDSQQSSTEDPAKKEAIEKLKLRLDPVVWRQIENQTWFDGGNTTDDGFRLMNLLSVHYLSRRPGDSLQVLRAYQDGLNEASERVLLNLESGDLIRMVAVLPWFTQGVDANEEAFLAVLAGAWARKGPGWTFDQVLIESMKSPWFTDGLDEKEAVVLNAAGALSGRNQDKAIQLVTGLGTNFFAFEKLSLPVSGEKTLIVTTPSGNMQSQLQQALALVKRWMVAVEDFVGAYKPQYVLVAVEELAPSLCGTGSGQLEDVPGFVTLNIGCIQDTTVVHELAHIFLGSGPIWFTEGAADLVVYHVTGKSGHYLSRSANGKAEPSAVIKLESGSPEYINQGALGADLLVEVYRLIGVERTSSVLKKVSSGEWPAETSILIRLFLDATPEESKQALNNIFANQIAQAR